MLLVRRLVPITLAAAVTGAAVVGVAATFGLASSDLGAGSAAIARCDTGGITVTYESAPGPVTAINISDLDSACDGGRAHAAVEDSAGDSSAVGSAVVAGGGARVALPSPRPAEDIARWRVVVVTP